jgi:hypothetical protein
MGRPSVPLGSVCGATPVLVLMAPISVPEDFVWPRAEEIAPSKHYNISRMPLACRC